MLALETPTRRLIRASLYNPNEPFIYLSPSERISVGILYLTFSKIVVDGRVTLVTAAVVCFHAHTSPSSAFWLSFQPSTIPNPAISAKRTIEAAIQCLVDEEWIAGLRLNP